MSSLQNKLYNYEQTPPEKVWDKIAAALDESHLEDKFPSTLYHAEVAPPREAWDKIAGSLQAENTPVVQITQKRFRFLRYAAAALVIGIIGFAVIKLTGNNNSPDKNPIAVKKQDTSETKSLVRGNEPKSDQEKSMPVEEADKNPVMLAVTDAGKISSKKAKARYAISDNAENMDDTERLYALNEDVPNIADRYIMLMTPNGIIRMSKKWGNLVCCVSGQEQDEDCKDQIKKWQEKLACASSSSTGNFMDLLSLVSSLDSEL